MTDGNGAATLAHVLARVAAMENALALLARRWQDELAPRLLAIEHDVDVLLELLRAHHQEEE